MIFQEYRATPGPTHQAANTFNLPGQPRAERRGERRNHALNQDR